MARVSAALASGLWLLAATWALYFAVVHTNNISMHSQGSGALGIFRRGSNGSENSNASTIAGNIANILGNGLKGQNATASAIAEEVTGIISSGIKNGTSHNSTSDVAGAITDIISSGIKNSTANSTSESSASSIAGEITKILSNHTDDGTAGSIAGDISSLAGEISQIISNSTKNGTNSNVSGQVDSIVNKIIAIIDSGTSLLQAVESGIAGGLSHNTTSSVNATATTATVFIDPKIWSAATPTVSCTPPCNLILPPYTLASNTTISFPALTTSITETFGKSTTTTKAVITFPPLTTSIIPVYGVNLSEPTSSPLTIIPSVFPSPTPLTIRPPKGVTNAPSIIQLTSPPGPSGPFPTSINGKPKIINWKSGPPGPKCVVGCGSHCIFFCGGGGKGGGSGGGGSNGNPNNPNPNGNPSNPKGTPNNSPSPTAPKTQPTNSESSSETKSESKSSSESESCTSKSTKTVSETLCIAGGSQSCTVITTAVTACSITTSGNAVTVTPPPAITDLYIVTEATVNSQALLANAQRLLSIDLGSDKNATASTGTSSTETGSKTGEKSSSETKSTPKESSTLTTLPKSSPKSTSATKTDEKTTASKSSSSSSSSLTSASKTTNPPSSSSSSTSSSSSSASSPSPTSGIAIFGSTQVNSGGPRGGAAIPEMFWHELPYTPSNGFPDICKTSAQNLQTMGNKGHLTDYPGTFTFTSAIQSTLTGCSYVNTAAPSAATGTLSCPGLKDPVSCPPVLGLGGDSNQQKCGVATYQILAYCDFPA